ncbi:hypothetical protein HBO07_08275 [Pseudomonas proteolytica]|nr:hypothetical protein [Pseudomonas proteolytica]NMZ11278.1 hypothetical protein [Pseudomonas proteolytica]NMZ37032.1 hypothetical protein [Pseudomonas proteolytica]
MDNWFEWVDEGQGEQMVLHQGEPAEAFEWFKVDTAKGNLQNRGPELIHRIQ